MEGDQPIILPIFTENCAKMKKIWPRCTNGIVKLHETVEKSEFFYVPAGGFGPLFVKVIFLLQNYNSDSLSSEFSIPFLSHFEDRYNHT